MKRFALISISMFLACCGACFAGGLLNISAGSAEFVRNPSRYASTEADAAAYNPAAIIGYKDGLFATIGNQFILKNFSHENILMKKTYEDSKPALLFPSAQIGYKKDFWGAFFTFTIPAGGAAVDYKKGSATTDMIVAGLTTDLALQMGASTIVREQSVKASLACYGFTLGGAISAGKIFSFAAAGRIVTGASKKELNMDFGVNAASGAATADWIIKDDIDENAMGFTGLLNMNVAPMEKMNIAVKYELATQLKYKQKVNKAEAALTTNAGFDAMIPAGVKEALTMGAQQIAAMFGKNDSTYRYDIPAMLDMGLAVKIMPKLEFSIGGSLCFDKAANWNGREKEVDNSWDVAAGVQSKINPKLLLSAGYTFCDVGIRDNDSSYVLECPDLNSHTIGLGAMWKIANNILLNVGVSGTIYPAMKTGDEMFNLKKTLCEFGLGISYFPGAKSE